MKMKLKMQLLGLWLGATLVNCLSQRDVCKEELARNSFGNYCVLFLGLQATATVDPASQRVAQGALAMCAAQLAQKQACETKSTIPSTVYFE